MAHSDFAAVWHRLPPELRRAFARDPARELTADDVDALVRAGARDAHVLWLETRSGRRKRWLTSWSFRRFVDEVDDAGPAVPGDRTRRRIVP